MKVEVKEALERIEKGLLEGQYKHVQHPRLKGCLRLLFNTEIPTPKDDGTRLFNMDYWARETPCGSIGCIGGWLCHELDRTLTKEEFTELDELFHPRIKADWATLKPEHSAKAIRNCLEGRHPWKGVETG